MQAVVMRTFGGAEVLELDEVPDPPPKAGEALVRMGAVAVSSTRDIATRSGQHPFSRQVSLPHVLGGDFAGVIEAVGAGVDATLIGRRVAASNSAGCGRCEACRAGQEAQCPQLRMLGIHRWGSYAELVTVPVQNLSPIPDDLSLSEAAAMAATGPIALTQLNASRLDVDEWTLVTGATGALATMLAVLAVSQGINVIGLSRRPARIPSALPLRAALEATDAALADAILASCGEQGAHAALDNVADGATFQRYFPALAIGARIIISGAISQDGPAILPIPAQPFYVRSLSLLGVRTTNRQDIARFWQLVADGLRLPAGLLTEFSLDEAARAHSEISAGAATGHTVLSVAG